MSIPAALGVGDCQGWLPGLARLEADAAIALCHGLLHHSLWNVAPHRVRRLSSLSQTGYRAGGYPPPVRLTNIADVTHDHALKRAKCTIDESVCAVPIFTLP